MPRRRPQRAASTAATAKLLASSRARASRSHNDSNSSSRNSNSNSNSNSNNSGSEDSDANDRNNNDQRRSDQATDDAVDTRNNTESGSDAGSERRGRGATAVSAKQDGPNEASGDDGDAVHARKRRVTAAGTTVVAATDADSRENGAEGAVEEFASAVATGQKRKRAAAGDANGDEKAGEEQAEAAAKTEDAKADDEAEGARTQRAKHEQQQRQQQQQQAEAEEEEKAEAEEEVDPNGVVVPPAFAQEQRLTKVNVQFRGQHYRESLLTSKRVKIPFGSLHVVHQDAEKGDSVRLHLELPGTQAYVLQLSGVRVSPFTLTNAVMSQVDAIPAPEQQTDAVELHSDGGEGSKIMGRPRSRRRTSRRATKGQRSASYVPGQGGRDSSTSDSSSSDSSDSSDSDSSDSSSDGDIDSDDEEFVSHTVPSGSRGGVARGSNARRRGNSKTSRNRKRRSRAKPKGSRGGGSLGAAQQQQQPMYAAKDDVWVACDRCGKWRKLPPTTIVDKLPQKWFCEFNPQKQYANCSAPQEPTTK